jgi:hypothetical protein
MFTGGMGRGTGSGNPGDGGMGGLLPLMLLANTDMDNLFSGMFDTEEEDDEET